MASSVDVERAGAVMPRSMDADDTVPPATSIVPPPSTLMRSPTSKVARASIVRFPIP
jgi:hypothetical protein